MADNTTLNAGTGGDVIGTDDIAGVKYQIVKIGHGLADVAPVHASATNPLPTQIGNGTTSTGVEPFGALMVNHGYQTLFYDSWSTSPIDTTDKWTVTGTTPTIASGNMQMSGTASTYNAIRTKDTIRPNVGFSHVRNGIRLEATAATGCGRFWGLGTPASVPSATSLAQYGIGFEIDQAAGTLLAVTYVGGVRTTVATLTRPVDGLTNAYGLSFRVTRAYWHIGNMQVAVAELAFPNVEVVELPALIVRQNAAAFVGTPVFTHIAHLTADTSRQGSVIADPVIGTRQARVSPAGGLHAALNGQTVTGTITAAGQSVTITDLLGAATVTLEGIATAVTVNSVAIEVLTAAGTWELAKWIYSSGTAGSIAIPLTLGSSGLGFSSSSIRVIADVTGAAGARFRNITFTGTSFAVTMVTSYAPTTRIGPDLDPNLASTKAVSVNQISGNAVGSFVPTSSAAVSGAGFMVAAMAPTPNTAEVGSSVRTATGNSGVISDALGGAVSGTLNITAVSGTTPTLDLALQESPDNGTTWVDVYHFERVTAVSVIPMPSIPINGRRRWAWTIAGTTPSFTFSVSISRGGFAQFPRFVQFFDRTAGLLAGTLNAVSATYQAAGCPGLTASVTLGAATTPASYKLQGSASGVSTEFYDLSAAVSAVANSTIAITNTGNLHARFVRLLVSAAGTAQTGTVTSITGTD